MVSLPNILPINIVGVVSGTAASGTPTDVFSLASIQNVVIVNEDPISVNILGTVVAATGTFSQSLTVSGLPVLTSAHNVPGGADNQIQYNDGGVFGGVPDFQFDEVTGQLLFPSGTLDDPSVSFKDSTSTGLFLDADALNLHIMADGTDHFNLGGGVTRLVSPIDAQNKNITNINTFTAVTGTVTSGISIGTGTTHIFPDEIRVEDMIILGNLTVSGTPVGSGGGGGGGLNNIVEDLTPELGGDLDGLSHDISGVSKLTVTGTQVLAPRGTTSLPGLAFSDRTDTGVRHDGSTHLQLIVDTAVVLESTSTIIQPIVPINAPSGSAAAPTIGFSGGTGLFRPAGPTLAFAVGGAQKLQMDADAVSASVPLRGPSGSASAPSVAFGADSNTGMFLRVLAPDNAIVFSVQGNEILTVTGTAGEPRGIGVDGGVTAISGTFFDTLNIPIFSADPAVSDGDVWINTTTSGIRWQVDGTKFEIQGTSV